MRVFSPIVAWEENGRKFSTASFMRDHADTLGKGHHMTCLKLGAFMLVYCTDDTIQLGKDDILLTKDNMAAVRAKLGLPVLANGERRARWQRWVRELVDSAEPKLKGKVIHFGAEISEDGR